MNRTDSPLDDPANVEVVITTQDGEEHRWEMKFDSVPRIYAWLRSADNRQRNILGSEGTMPLKRSDVARVTVNL